MEHLLEEIHMATLDWFTNGDTVTVAAFVFVNLIPRDVFTGEQTGSIKSC
jgi:hypothetical protein